MPARDVLRVHTARTERNARHSLVTIAKRFVTDRHIQNGFACVLWAVAEWLISLHSGEYPCPTLTARPPAP
jgi:hypothetical protein